jgi:nitrile hydratase accessory protein
MRAEGRAGLFATTAFLFSRTATRISWASSRSTYIPFSFQRRNYGEATPRRAIRFIWTCGTAILSTPDFEADLAQLPRLPVDDGGPVFGEPWQAQAFALAVRLSAQGHFSWKEWAAALAQELRAAADRGEADDGSRYYEYWLAALEKLTAAKGLSNKDEMSERKEAWGEAYRHTPHGKPVELRKAPRTQT